MAKNVDKFKQTYHVICPYSQRIKYTRWIQWYTFLSISAPPCPSVFLRVSFARVISCEQYNTSGSPASHHTIQRHYYFIITLITWYLNRLIIRPLGKSSFEISFDAHQTVWMTSILTIYCRRQFNIDIEEVIVCNRNITFDCIYRLTSSLGLCYLW